MDSFLSRLDGDGELDSSGEFTISREKALAKLVDFAFEEPELWVLKMVQAAVAGGASRVLFWQTSRSLTVGFDLDNPPQADEVFGAVFSPTDAGSLFLNELAFGLRALLNSRSFEVRSVQPGCRRAAGLKWDQNEIRKGKKRALKASLEIVVSAIDVWFEKGARRRLEQFQHVFDRAAYCPIPIIWDSREVSVLNQKPFHISESPVNLMAGYLYEVQGDGERAVANRRTNPIKEFRPLLSWKRRPEPCQGSFQLFFGRAHNGKIEDAPFNLVWTRLGVSCAAHQYLAALGGFFELSGDHLKTDLSGLKLEITDADILAGKKQLPRIRPMAESAIQRSLEIAPVTTYREMASGIGQGVFYLHPFVMVGLFYSLAEYLGSEKPPPLEQRRASQKRELQERLVNLLTVSPFETDSAATVER